MNGNQQSETQPNVVSVTVDGITLTVTTRVAGILRDVFILAAVIVYVIHALGY